MGKTSKIINFITIPALIASILFGYSATNKLTKTKNENEELNQINITAKAENEELRNSLAESIANAKTFKDALEVANTRLSQVDIEIAEKDSTITSLQAEIKELKQSGTNTEELAELQTRLETALTEKSQLETEKSTLQTQITSLQNTLIETEKKVNLLGLVKESFYYYSEPGYYSPLFSLRFSGVAFESLSLHFLDDTSEHTISNLDIEETENGIKIIIPEDYLYTSAVLYYDFTTQTLTCENASDNDGMFTYITRESEITKNFALITPVNFTTSSAKVLTKEEVDEIESLANSGNLILYGKSLTRNTGMETPPNMIYYYEDNYEMITLELKPKGLNKYFAILNYINVFDEIEVLASFGGLNYEIGKDYEVLKGIPFTCTEKTSEKVVFKTSLFANADEETIQYLLELYPETILEIENEIEILIVEGKVTTKIFNIDGNFTNEDRIITVNTLS